MKNRFKRMKLATKTAMVIGILLVILFTVLISITVVLTSSALTTAADTQFNLMSEKNALNIQAPFDAATSLATDLQFYVETKYSEYDMLSPTDPKIAEKKVGVVYNQPMEVFSVEMEDYIINTISSAVENNDEIMAAGVFFEPFAYDTAVRDYSLYISVEDHHNYQSLGTYEEYKEESYYKTASETKQPFFTPPYEYNGIYMISASYPILFEGVLQGVVCVDINVSNFVKIMSSDSRYPSLYQDVLTNDGTIVFDSTTPNGDYVGVNLGDWLTEESKNVMISKFAENKTFYMKDRNASGENIERYFFPVKAGSHTWWALTGVNTAEKNAATSTTVWVLLVLSAAALTIIIMVTVIVLRRMINPIKSVVEAAESISAGNFNISLTATSEDEIGVLSKSFSKTAETLKTVILDISKVLNEMSAGNLTITPNAEYNGDLKQIEDSIRNILLNLNSVMKNIKDSSVQVSDNSSNIAQGAQSLAEGATDQASSIEELQATITSITAQVEKNADNAKIADQMAHTAGQELKEGNQQMNRMLEAMKEISEASTAIQEVITTIEDIASQTNLLSLNASIEAARAGDAGKGFAVVADQVGKLASESAEATKATSNLIQASMRAVENGISIADLTAQTIESSVAKVQDVVANVAKISEANSTQAVALDQITKGVEQISCVIEENSAMAEESASSSEELSAQAVVLDELVSKFKLN